MHRHRLRLGDYRRVLLAAFGVCDHPVALVTITPPGHDVLPPDPESFKRWNRTAAWKWKRLDARAKGWMRRRGMATPCLLARVAQRQARGLDHLHLVFRCETASDRAAIATYVRLLDEFRHDYEFGWVDDPFKLVHPRGRDGRPNLALPKRDRVFESAEVAGRYLCRYLTESKQLVQLLDAPDASFRPLWVSPELTKVSRVTCTRLRRVRHAFHVFASLDQGSRPTLPAWWNDLSERFIIRALLSPHVAAVP